jgi:hypothetical protein
MKSIAVTFALIFGRLSRAWLFDRLMIRLDQKQRRS